MGLKVLSLFDGIATGRLALEKAQIKVENYYSSEKEEDSIKIALKNWPDIIQLGDVTKWKEWNLPKIDLLIAGSPCQDFSKANIKGKGLNGDKSSLFYIFYEILKELKPKYFLLENSSAIKKDDLFEINRMLRCEPIELNSNLVSAQNRSRYYWTNFNISRIEDKNITLENILEDSVDSKYFLQKEKHFFTKGQQNKEKRLIFLGAIKTKNSKIWLDDGKVLSRNFKQGYRVYSKKGIAPCLTASGGGLAGKTALINIGSDTDIKVENIRRLTPVEAERLQNLPDNYTEGVSESSRLKAVGNGWSADIITEIFKGLKK